MGRISLSYKGVTLRAYKGSLSGQLFHSTQIPACVCFLVENKAESNSRRARLSEENELSLVA